MNRIIAITIALLTLADCKAKQEPIQPDVFLRELDSALRERYYFYPDSDYNYNLSEIYGAALKDAVDYQEATSDLTTAIKQIQASASDEETITKNTIKFANATLMRLPDQSSYYIDPASLNLLNDEDRQAGTGIVIRRTKEGRFRVVDVLDGSPAQRADLQVGSYIEAVDGEPTTGLSVEGVAGRIRGPLDTEVELILDGKKYVIVRAQFPAPAPARNVWQLGEKKVLIVQLRSALEGSATTLKNILAGSEKYSAIVLDIRKLNYGRFDEVFQMADLLIQNEFMGSSHGRTETKQTYTANSEQIYTGPVYVLVSTSASPFSEVFAAALSSSEKVRLIGPRLKGNAYMADSIQLGSGMLRLTTGIIKGPDGKPLFLNGIATDIQTSDYLPASGPLSSPEESDPAHQAVVNALQ